MKLDKENITQHNMNKDLCIVHRHKQASTYI